MEHVKFDKLPLEKRDIVILHEAGHILLNRYFNWNIDNIKKDHHGAYLVIFNSKMIDGIKVTGCIVDPKSSNHRNLNWERIIISQGGRAAEYIKRRPEPKYSQFKIDDENANEVLATLTNINILEARRVALRLVEINQDILELVINELNLLLNGGNYNFSEQYLFTSDPDLDTNCPPA